MGIIQKQAIRNTFYTYLGVVLSFISTSLLFPHILSPDEIGLLKVLTSAALLFSQFSSLGFNSVTVRFFGHFRDKEKRHHGFLFYAVMVALVGFLAWLVFFFIFREDVLARYAGKSKLFADYLVYLVPFVFFLLYFSVFDAYARAVYNSVVGMFLKEFLQRALIIVCVLLYFLKMMDFTWMVAGYVISFGLSTTILALYLIRQKEWSLRPDLSKMNRKLAREMASMSFFSILVGLASVTISEIASLILADKLTLSEVGIWGTLYNFGLIVVLPARALYSISNTVIADSWLRNDLDNIRLVYRKSCINQLLIGTFLFLGIWCNIDSILKIIPPEYAAGKYIVFFLGLGNLVEMATGVNGVIIANSKYYRYDTLFIVALIGLTIATNLLFIPMYGVVGSAIALAVTISTFNVARYFFLYGMYGMQPYTIDSLKVVVVGLVTFALCSLVPWFDNFFLDAGIRCAIIAVAFWVLAVKMKVSEEIYDRIRVYLSLAGIKI